MTFKTDFIAEDYSTLCWFQAKRTAIIMSLLFALAFAFTFYGISTSVIIGAVVGILSFPIMMYFQKRHVIKRADTRFGAFGASSELYLEIDDDEIRQTAASGNTRLPWQDVYGVSESKDSYYVFLSKAKAFYFPKRSFESEEQKELFFDYVKKYVPQKKIKIKF